MKRPYKKKRCHIRGAFLFMNETCFLHLVEVKLGLETTIGINGYFGSGFFVWIPPSSKP